MPRPKGLKLSDETKKKMSIAHKGRPAPWNIGHIPWNKGLHIRLNTGRTHFKKGSKGFWLGKKRPEISGSKHGMWKGGRVKRHGYWYILMPEHSRAHKNGYVKECYLVLEKKLGHSLLLNEFPHHINSIKDDDRPKNLEPTTRSKHIKTHNPLQYRWRQ